MEMASWPGCRTTRWGMISAVRRAETGLHRLADAQRRRPLQHREVRLDLLNPTLDVLDADLVLEVHLEVCLGLGAVFDTLPVLTHHDDGTLERRHDREEQVEEDERE